MHELKQDKRALALAASGLFGLIVAFSFASMAENTELDSGPRVFPYHGILEFDGVPVDSPMDIEFTVSDANNNCVFEERHEAVPFTQGAYSVVIGQIEGGVAECIWEAEEIYISLAVRPNDDDPRNNLFAALSGRQRVFPAPFAYWAASAEDLTVDGGLNTGELRGNGALTVSGDMSASSLRTSGGAVTISGNATMSDLTMNNFRDPTTVVNGALTVNNAPTFANNFATTGTMTMAGDNGDLSTSTLTGVSSINSDGTDWETGGNLTVNGNVGNFRNTVVATSTSGTNIINGTLTSDVNGVDIDVTGLTTWGNGTGDSTTANRLFVSGTCRLCLLWGDSCNTNDDSSCDRKGYSCIPLSAGSVEKLDLSGNVNADDMVGLSYVCDGGGEQTRAISSNVSWPGE